MKTNRTHQSGSQYWQSLTRLAETPETRAQLLQEFPGDPNSPDHPSRRSFLKIAGASMAVAGLSLSGCRRWPKESLVPQSSKDKTRIPGQAEYYATAMEIAGVSVGLLATSYDGRPVKIEGNGLHPYSMTANGLGSADKYAQAATIELYDPDRSRGVFDRTSRGSAVSTLDSFYAAAAKFITAGGAGFAVLTEAMSGGSFLETKKRFLAKFPQAQWFEYEPLSWDSESEGARLAYGQPLRTVFDLTKAKTIVSFDADLLGTHPAHVRYANDWSKGRRSADAAEGRQMNRLYLAESAFTITGAVADERLPVQAGRIGAMMSALASQLGVADGSDVTLTASEAKFVNAAAEDLGSGGIVAVGSHLPAELHALGLAINARIGSIGADKAVTLRQIPGSDRVPHATAITTLAAKLKDKSITSLLILGGNPAYDAPVDTNFASLLQTLQNSAHLSVYDNETSRLCKWHVNRAHFLESWADGYAYDGTVTIGQPLIQPMFGGVSPIELLATLAGEEQRTGQAIVMRTITAVSNPAYQYSATGAVTNPDLGDVVARRALHDGYIVSTAPPAFAVGAPRVPTIAKTASPEWEVRFLADPHVYDGRFANNGWLQELPDTISKLTWDNAAFISKFDADKHKIAQGDMIRVTIGGKALEIAAYILPGQPLGVIGLPLGYGRTAAGHMGNNLGFNTYSVRSSTAPFIASADKVEKTGATYKLVMTVDHFLIDDVGFKGREFRVGTKGHSGPVINEATFAEYIKSPQATRIQTHGNLALQLFDPPNTFNTPHAWGMAIDMNTCIGCNACAIACQIENNIPIVGKPAVERNREMHWLRVDRYFKGDRDDQNPQVVFQPMMCVHCENAPCEQVCPVGATVHDTEGLNAMTYNRCIGTRYCSNNCPYKVRRFNYFDWHSKDPRGIINHVNGEPLPYLNFPDQQQHDQVNEVRRLGYNPEVTIRMRGIMEKCTYCTQRIQSAKIKAKNAYMQGFREKAEVQEGEIVTACQQACPTQAIVFGNLNDPESAVVKLQKNNRAYTVLEDLNTRPRSRYLAKLRNPAEAADARTAVGMIDVNAADSKEVI